MAHILANKLACSVILKDVWKWQTRLCQIVLSNAENRVQCNSKFMNDLESQNVCRAEHVFRALETWEEVLLFVCHFKYLCYASHFDVSAIGNNCKPTHICCVSVLYCLTVLMSLIYLIRDYIRSNFILSKWSMTDYAEIHLKPFTVSHTHLLLCATLQAKPLKDTAY